MYSVDFKFRWADVQIATGYNYRFSNPLSAFMKEQCCFPAVYRWHVWAPTVGPSALYVGETDNLARRIQQYLSPGPRQATNLRLKAYFDEATEKGELVELQTLQFEALQINKLKVSMDALGDAHIRRLLESLILAEIQADVQFARPLVLNQIFVQNAERRKKRIREADLALRKLGTTQSVAAIEALKEKFKG
jgi:hypothetical protein